MWDFKTNYAIYLYEQEIIVMCIFSGKEKEIEIITEILYRAMRTIPYWFPLRVLTYNPTPRPDRFPLRRARKSRIFVDPRGKNKPNCIPVLFYPSRAIVSITIPCLCLRIWNKTIILKVIFYTEMTAPRITLSRGINTFRSNWKDETKLCIYTKYQLFLHYTHFRSSVENTHTIYS